MSALIAPDERLTARLPLPLAQLYRRACNARSPLDRHLSAFYLWEAVLKLLGSVCVVEYVRLGHPDPGLDECLQSLARPSLGHWWGFVRRLTPVLADRDVPGFVGVRDLLLGKRRDDLPWAAGLDSALRETLDGKAGTGATVYPVELFDRLVRYRNREIGHGAAGQREVDFYDRMGRSLLLATAELLGKLDPLAGRRLLYIAEVRQVGGRWRLERYELAGESPRRLETVDLPPHAAAVLPHGERVYLGGADESAGLTALFPLLAYEMDADRFGFLNGRRGKAGAEYLCYSSGKTWAVPELIVEQRELLARALGLAEVSEAMADAWAAKSRAEEPADEPPPSGPARRMGDFELLSELGRGGMGVVYRAWQPSLGRQVAVKSLARPGDPRAEARFRREIRALGRVEHPRVVKIHTSGIDGENWFFAMELVEGAPLSDVCQTLVSRAGTTEVDLTGWRNAVDSACSEVRRRERPLGSTAEEPAPPATPEPAGQAIRATPEYVRQVVALVRQVAEAADALHGHKIVHRDIKPGNVVVNAAGDQATLLDLGLAQLADDVEGRLTKTRQFVGTLRYASPEQVAAVAEVDGRSDVYSLGATLWELLALSPLFGATDGTPTHVLMEKILHEEPARLRSVQRGVTRDLEAVVHRCLEKRAAGRYQTAQELAADLGRYLDGEPVRARPVGWLDRRMKWLRRHPREATAGTLGLLAAVLLLVGGAFGLLWHEADTARRDAVKANEEVKEALGKAEEAKGRAEMSFQTAREAQSNADQARIMAEEQGKARVIAEKQLGEQKAASAKREADLARRLIDRFRNNLTLQQAQKLNDAGEYTRARQEMEVIPESQREWEWYYVLNQIPQFFPINGHTDSVTSLAWSLDGRRVVSASRDKTLKVWDADTKMEKLTLKGHKGTITSVAWSPDGGRIVSGSDDETIKVWDLKRRQTPLTLKGHLLGVNSVAWSPDGNNVASGSWDKTLKVWDALTGQEVLDLKGHTGSVTSVAFSPDGRRIASASHDGTLKLWNSATGKELRTLKGHTENVTSVAFSPDGKQVVSSSEDKTLKVWDSETGEELRTLKGHTERVTSVAFSPDGKLIASGDLDGTMKVWEGEKGDKTLTLKGHTRGVTCLTWSPDGRRIASGSHDNTLGVWDALANRKALTLKGDTAATCMACSSNGKQMVTGSNGGFLEMWDTEKSQIQFTTKGHPDQVTVVTFSPDGKHIASGGWDSTLKVWDTEKGQMVRTLKGHTSGITSVAWSPDGTRIASGGGDNTVKVWDVGKGLEILTLKGYPDSVDSVAWSPDSKRIHSTSSDKMLRVWDAEKGKELFSRKGTTYNSSIAAWSPDGRRVASASKDNTLRVWDAERGEEVLILHGHTARIESVAFSPDGRHLISGSRDGTLRLWDADTGQELLTLNGHCDYIDCVAYSRDGKRIFSSQSDKTLKVWETNTKHLWHIRQAATMERTYEWARAAWFLGYCFQQETMLQVAEPLCAITSLTPIGAVANLVALRQREGRVERDDLLWRRMDAYQKIGRWSEAEEDFRRLRAEKRDTSGHWHYHTWGVLAKLHEREILRAATDTLGAIQPFGYNPGLALPPLLPRPCDTTEFQTAWEEMSKRFHRPDASTADELAWTRLLVGDGLDRELQTRLVKLARQAVENDPDIASYRETLGAALYRSGQHADAIKELDAAIKKEGKGGTYWMQTFRAMAQHRSGKEKEACESLTQAAKLIEGTEKSNSRLGWKTRVEWHYLRREAEATLGWRIPAALVR